MFDSKIVYMKYLPKIFVFDLYLTHYGACLLFEGLILSAPLICNAP